MKSMEADWEIEIGGGAPVVEPYWQGFMNLRCTPEAAEVLPEVSVLPGLARVLAALNAADSPVWTAKCDVWEMDGFDPHELDAADETERVGISCYVDLLPSESLKWSIHDDTVNWCKQVCLRLQQVELRSCRVELVVRAAELGNGQKAFAVTAYGSAVGEDGMRARRRLVEALTVLSDTLREMNAPDVCAKKLQ